MYMQQTQLMHIVGNTSPNVNGVGLSMVPKQNDNG